MMRKDLNAHIRAVQKVTALRCPRAVHEQRNGKGKVVRKVAEPWNLIDARETEHTFDIALHVPIGYSVNDLMQETDALFATAGRPISIKNRGGVAIITIAKKDIENSIDFDDRMLDALTGRQVLLGFDINKSPIIHDFRVPHLMFAGMSGYGKTDFARLVLYQLIKRLTPDQLEIYIIDMKGFSFMPFRHVPHVKIIARDLPSAVVVLADSYNEMNRRSQIVWNSGKRDTAKGFRWRVILIDEASQISPMLREVKEDKKLAAICWQYAGAISCIGREAGIGILFGTQYPTHEVIRGQIKANMDAVLCFRTENEVHSQVALGRSSAAYLPHGVAGRAILKRDDIQIQVPYVGDDDRWDALLEPYGDPAHITPLEGGIDPAHYQSPGEYDGEAEDDPGDIE